MYDGGGATSAAPIYFDLKILITPIGTNEYLIDGGVVEKNPTMFAISLNVDIIGDTRPIRIFSIGTGAWKAKDVVATGFSGLDWWL
jgi:patatin-like phospholipase/acyl hydrolase